MAAPHETDGAAEASPKAAPLFVTGATGYVGGRLVGALLERGYSVRCFTRSRAKIESRPFAGDARVTIVEGRLLAEDELAAQMRGCRVAYYLVHSMQTVGKAYRDHDRRLAETFGRAARRAGVARIIYLGGLGETGPDLSEHLSSRREVETYLAAAGVPVTTFRAAMIIGSGSASFEILRYLVERLPAMVTPRWVETDCQPIAIRNVLHYLAACVEVPETTGMTLDIGGPDTLSYRALIQLTAQARGLPRRRIWSLPLLTPRLSARWIHLVTPLDAHIARPLTEGLRNRVVCRDTRAQSLMPQPLLTVQEAIEAALEKWQRGDVMTAWSDAGPMPGDPDWSGGTVFVDERSIEVAAPASKVFQEVERIGGDHGYYAANFLWRIRGWLDRLAGGPGLRRGRRDPQHLAFGEAVDFWRVAHVVRDQRIELRAEMKLPGVATLEFRTERMDDGRTRLFQTARFRPRGLFGLLYWYGVAPLHRFVFPSMIRGIARAIEATP